MRVYGITIITFDGNEVPSATTRVFATEEAWANAYDDLELTENQEIYTFEALVEGV